MTLRSHGGLPSRLQKGSSGDLLSHKSLAPNCDHSIAGDPKHSSVRDPIKVEDQEAHPYDQDTIVSSGESVLYILISLD